MLLPTGIVQQAAGGAAGTTLVYDTFTDSDGVLLPVHTPDTDTVGGGWANNLQSQAILSNKCVENASGAVSISTIDCGSADVIITADCTFAQEPTTKIAPSNICFRYVDSNNYWYAGATDLSTTPWTWGIYENNAGSQTSRASAQGSTTGGNSTVTAAVQVILSGTSIQLIVADEGINVSYTSSLHQSATKHGFRMIRFNAPSVNCIADNFKVVAN